MKRNLFFALCAMAFVAVVSCNKADKIVDYPLIETSSTMTIDLARVELTDTLTKLYVEAYAYPRTWIRISSDSYLKAKDKKYKLVSAMAIEPDSLFYMPESGEASFVLLFEPLPKSTKSFDYIESDCENCFKLFGIDLTGKSSFDVSDRVPAQLREVDLTANLPEPIFKSGKTKIRFHFMGYREEFADKLNLYVNTIFTEQQNYTVTIDKESGVAEFEYLQCGPAHVLYSLGRSLNGSIWVAPCDDVNLYVDMRAIGHRILTNRAGRGKCAQPEPFRTSYSDGIYGNLNNAISLPVQEYRRFPLNAYFGEFADYKMSAEEYVSFVTEKYKTYTDSIAQSNLPQLLKEYEQISLKQEILSAMANGDNLRSHNYRALNNFWDFSKKVEVDELNDSQRATVAKLFNVNDPMLLMGRNMTEYTACVSDNAWNWLAEAGITEGLAADLYKVFGFVREVKNLELTEADRQLLNSMENKFFKEAFEAMEAEQRAKLAEVEGKAVIEATPDVAVDKLFDAIIAPYKGKVILVDFWNTWCAPCRMAIEATEPLKENDLKSDDLVWIYIANETSPMVTYKSMIPDIKGKHFRLNKEQWSYLCDKFDIDGIPSYVLVEKSGSYKLRNDFRSHSAMKETLKERLGLNK